MSAHSESVAREIAANQGTCEVCDRPAGHPGRHEATFLLCGASEGWTGSPEQWAEWNAKVAAGTAITVRVIELPPAPPAVTHTGQQKI